MLTWTIYFHCAATLPEEWLYQLDKFCSWYNFLVEQHQTTEKILVHLLVAERLAYLKYRETITLRRHFLSYLINIPHFVYNSTDTALQVGCSMKGLCRFSRVSFAPLPHDCTWTKAWPPSTFTSFQHPWTVVDKQLIDTIRSHEYFWTGRMAARLAPEIYEIFHLIHLSWYSLSLRLGRGKQNS